MSYILRFSDFAHNHLKVLSTKPDAVELICHTTALIHIDNHFANIVYCSIYNGSGEAGAIGVTPHGPVGGGWLFLKEPWRRGKDLQKP